MLSQPLLIDRNLSWHAWFKSAGLKLNRDNRRHFIYRYERADGAARWGKDCARTPVIYTIGYSRGKAGSPVRAWLARCLLPYAVYPIASESNPALVAFRDWLIEEARRA